MIQYKLISEYPGSPKLGTIDWFDTDESGSSSNDNWKGTRFYNSNPKFWQKVEEVDYEILSWISPSGRLETKIHSTYDSLHTKIESVKRLSDGEVFTIGDLIDFGGF